MLSTLHEIGDDQFGIPHLLGAYDDVMKQLVLLNDEVLHQRRHRHEVFCYLREIHFLELTWVVLIPDSRVVAEYVR